MAALICLAPLFSTNTAQAAGGDVVSVADYGAAADSGEDSAPAIIKAVDKAKELAAEGKNVTIAFPKGRYDIYPDKAERRTLYVSNTVGTNSSYKTRRSASCLRTRRTSPSTARVRISCSTAR